MIYQRALFAQYNSGIARSRIAYDADQWEVELARLTEEYLRTRPRFSPAQHGTTSGYKRHLRNKDKSCGPCRAANAAYRRNYLELRAMRAAA